MEHTWVEFRIAAQLEPSTRVSCGGWEVAAKGSQEWGMNSAEQRRWCLELVVPAQYGPQRAAAEPVTGMPASLDCIACKTHHFDLSRRLPMTHQRASFPG